MPNHCNNTLMRVDGLPIGKLFNKFLKKGKGFDKGDNETLDANKIIPIPKGIRKTMKFSTVEWIQRNLGEDEKQKQEKKIEKLKKENFDKYGSQDWYDWCVANWGTKWGCYDGGITEQSLWFASAWSPPIPVIAELSKKINVSLRLIYIEEGDYFCGEYIANPDGQSIDNFYDNIDESPQSLQDELGYEKWEEEE
jgi:hypothetical protein